MTFHVDTTGIFGRAILIHDTGGMVATTAREALRLVWPADEKPTPEQAVGIAAHNRKEVARAKRMFKKAARFFAK